MGKKNDKKDGKKDDRQPTGRKSDPAPSSGKKDNRKEAKERAQAYTRTSEATKIALNKKGRIDGINGNYVGGGFAGQIGNAINPKDRKQINKYIKKNDYSLTGGDGRAVIGYKKVTITPDQNFALINKGMGWAPDRTEMLPIYGKVKAKKGGGKGDGRGGSGGGGGGSGSYGGGSTSGGGSEILRRGAAAEDRLYGRNPEGWKPPMFPEGESIEGRAPEAIADYTDRLDRYNQNMIGWMNDRAVASQYEMGTFLDRFAAGLPPAPDVLSPEQLLRLSQKGARTEF